MTDEAGFEMACDPQDLERLLIERQWAGDVDGMAALYEPDAVLDCGEGQLMFGRPAIRAFFSNFNATGKKFTSGKQSPAVISGDLALTSTHLPDGSVTAEVARRQSDGTWLWAIDRYSVA
ncbi:MAG: nuclear transport factor 2 family protein [Anderseniella sp.]